MVAIRLVMDPTPTHDYGYLSTSCFSNKSFMLARTCTCILKMALKDTTTYCNIFQTLIAHLVATSTTITQAQSSSSLSLVAFGYCNLLLTSITRASNIWLAGELVNCKRTIQKKHQQCVAMCCFVSPSSVIDLVGVGYGIYYLPWLLQKMM